MFVLCPNVNLHVCLAGLSISGCYCPQPVGLGGDPEGLGRLQQQLAGLRAQQARQMLPHPKRVKLRRRGTTNAYTFSVCDSVLEKSCFFAVIHQVVVSGNVLCHYSERCFYYSNKKLETNFNILQTNETTLQNKSIKKSSPLTEHQQQLNIRSFT